jgi:hypothetical protein
VEGDGVAPNEDLNQLSGLESPQIAIYVDVVAVFVVVAQLLRPGWPVSFALAEWVRLPHPQSVAAVGLLPWVVLKPKWS